MLGNTSVTSVMAAGSFVIYSDKRFKKDIKQDVPGLEFINMLRPVTYHYNIHDLNKHISPKIFAADKQRVDQINIQASAQAKTKGRGCYTTKGKEIIYRFYSTGSRGSGK